MSQLTITPLPISTLKPYANNARRHSARQVRKIADSIRAFGFTNPVLIDRDNGIVAGHGRVEAAKLLHMAEVPTIRLEHMTPEQIRAYVIADNRIAEQAGWDTKMLAIEFQGLMELDLGFDLEVTGFELPEIDLMIQDQLELDEDKADVIPAEPPVPVTRLGDLWQLGEHRLLCGNALEGASYARLMGGEKAQMVFTDPPYNVRINGHVSGLGAVKHGEFAMASGEMSEAQFTAFLSAMAGLLATHAANGAIHFICMDWRHMGELMAACKPHYAELKNVCVWNKDNGGMGALYRSKHELVFVFKQGDAPHINNVGLGRHGRYRTNVWNYRAPRRISRSGEDELAMHPTVKPVRMIGDALKDCSHRGGLVLDPFGGSGSTLIAAEQTGRKARLIELEPKYVDVTIVRWQKQTNQKAVLVETGQTFDETKHLRETCHA